MLKKLQRLKGHLTYTVFVLVLLIMPLTFSGCTHASFVDEVTKAAAFTLKEEGNALLAQKQYEEALEKYKESMELNPDYIPNYYNLGTTYAYLGNKKEAIKNFNLAIEHGYTKPRIYYNMAYFYNEWGEFDKSIELYQLLLEKNPHDLASLQNLTIAYKKAERFDEAKKLASKGLSLIDELEEDYKENNYRKTSKADNVIPALNGYRRTLLLLQDNMKIDERWNTEPDDPSYHLSLCQDKKQHCEEAGYIALKAKRKDEALNYFETACHKGFRLSCAQGGFLAYKKKNSPLAEELYQKGCSLKDKTACIDLAELFWEKNQKDVAFKLYEKACDLGSARACGLLGDYFIKKNPAKAKQWYETSCHLGNKEGCRRASKVNQPFQLPFNF